MSTTEAETEPTFEPEKYLTQISGRPYLEVRWRLLWLRSIAPDAHIKTRLVSDDGQRAVFRAVVTIPGAGSATGYGSETEGDFHDYLEKSETKAIGRALGALGYGTQFCDDHAGEAAAGRPVDTPTFQPRRGGKPDTASEKQIKFVYAVGRQAGYDNAELARLAGERYGSSPEGLSRREASEFIDFLKVKADEPPVATKSIEKMGALIGGADPRKPDAPRPVTAAELSGKREPAPVNPDAPSEAQMRKLHATARDHNWTPDAVKEVMRDLWSIDSSKALTRYQCGLLIDLIEDRMALTYDANGKARLGQAGPVPTDDGKLSLDELPFDPAPVAADN